MHVTQFYLPDIFDLLQIFQSFVSIGTLKVDPPTSVQRTYLDTFDWRLHAAGSILIEEQEPYVIRTRWQHRADDRLLGQIMAAAPRFAWDLPQGLLREQLEACLAMRALMPMARVNLTTHRAVLLNKQRKTILRLAVEIGVAVAPNQRSAETLSARLRLEPVKGYRKPLLQALDIVHEKLGLEPAGHLFDEALEAIGREPADYSSKLNIKLNAEMPAGEAVRRVLLCLLETMQRNVEGTKSDRDSEFLHDFRVAVRRTRSLFSEVKGVLPPVILQRFKPGFKWLGQITGPTRDLDVYLLKLPDYRKNLPDSIQHDLEPLHAYLVKHQKIEQRKLAKQLGSARFRRLVNEWRGFLEVDFDPAAWPEKASRPIGEIASRRTWKVYRLVISEGEAIADHTPAAALHELRITCKKLRYLMEFFQSIYPAKKIRKQIKALKSLQDNLGDFHDLEVQADALREFGHVIQAEQHDLPRETFMAMGVLIDSLHQQQQTERRNFAERFARFARPANRKTCRELFKPLPTDKEPM